MQDMLNDVRRAVRSLLRARWFTAGVVLTLALGIGAAATIFSVVDRVLLRPLPYRQSERLVVLQTRNGTSDAAAMTAAEFAALRTATRSATAIGAYAYSEFVISGDPRSERVIGGQVTADVFEILGVQPAVGRVFRRGEDGVAAARVVVLSHALWRRRYGQDRSIVGRSIRLDGQQFIVVGVTDARLEFPRSGMMARNIELWTPVQIDPSSMQGRMRKSLTGVARLRDGVAPAAAAAEFDLALNAANPGTDTGRRARVAVAPISEHIVGKVRAPLFALLAAVAVLLAVVCANTTNLMLARGAGRDREVSIRLALGAHGRDVVRPVLVESILLSVSAAVLGVLATTASRGLVTQILPESLPRQGSIAIDVRLLAFVAVLAVLVGLICGALPALRLVRRSALSSLAETTRTTVGSRGLAVQRGLVVAQITAGTLLLTATGATLVAYGRLHTISPGFRSAGAITMSVSTGGMRYRDPSQRVQLLDALLARSRALPGVTAAATTNILPLGGGIMAASYAVVGVTDTDSAAMRTAPVRSVSDGYFVTLGIPIVRGRAIDATDDGRAAHVAVVNEAFARDVASLETTIGARVRVSSPMVDAATVTIVGIAADTKERGLTGDAVPMIYVSARQSPFPYNNFIIRTTGASAPIVSAMRSELSRLDGDLAIDEVAALEARVSSTYALQRFGSALLSAFGGMAVLLVALGVFAVVSGQVAAELKSIGIRMALGATPARIQTGVLRHALQLGALGVAFGVALSFALRNAIAAVARDTAYDHWSIVVLAGASQLVIAVAASWLPALRASRTDPKLAMQ